MPDSHLIQATGSARHPDTIPDMIFNLPHPSLPGNSGVLLIEFSGTQTFTITDDKGNTWNHVAGAAVTTAPQNQRVYYCEGMTTGTQKITVTPSSNVGFFRVQFQELPFVGTVNTSGSGTGTSTNANNNVTPTTPGCMVLHFVTQGSTDGYFLDSIVSNTPGAELLLVSNWDGNASQFRVYNGTTVLNMSIIFPSSVEWSSSAIALNPSANGTPLPTGGVRCRRRQFYSAMAPGSGTSAVINLAAEFTTLKTQTPRGEGSCLVHSVHAWHLNSNDHSVLNITDVGNNNIFKAGATTFFISGQRADVDIWYSPDAKPTSPLDTIVWKNVVCEATCAAYELVGVRKVNPCLVTVVDDGASLIDPFDAGVITPTMPGSAIIANLPVELSTINESTSPSNRAFDGFWSSSMDGGFNRLEEDNGHGFYISPNTDPQTWSWGTTGGDATNWGIVLAEFLPEVPLEHVYSIRKSRYKHQV